MERRSDVRDAIDALYGLVEAILLLNVLDNDVLELVAELLDEIFAFFLGTDGAADGEATVEELLGRLRGDVAGRTGNEDG